MVLVRLESGGRAWAWWEGSWTAGRLAEGGRGQEPDREGTRPRAPLSPAFARAQASVSSVSTSPLDLGRSRCARRPRVCLEGVIVCSSTRTRSARRKDACRTRFHPCAPRRRSLSSLHHSPGVARTPQTVLPGVSFDRACSGPASVGDLSTVLPAVGSSEASSAGRARSGAGEKGWRSRTASSRAVERATGRRGDCSSEEGYPGWSATCAARSERAPADGESADSPARRDLAWRRRAERPAHNHAEGQVLCDSRRPCCRPCERALRSDWRAGDGRG